MTNNKLIKDETLIILPELALEIGLNESIVLQQLSVELQKRSTILDGKRWFQQTYVEWQEVFPFWSASTIKRIFLSLQKQGLVLIEQHGKHRYDRTNWYAICEEKLQPLVPNKEEIINDVIEIDQVETMASAEEIKDNDNGLPAEIQENFVTIKERLKELQFFPLKKEQSEELIEVCRTYSLKQIIGALEITAAKSIYAWKYAYKVLITAVASQKRPLFGKHINRTEMLPDWFQNIKKEKETIHIPISDEDPITKRRRLEAIQMKYKKSAATST